MHFIDSLGIGGKERQVVEVVKGLRQVAQLDQLIVCMDDDEFYRPEIDKLKIPLELLIRRIRWDPFIFLKICKIFTDFKPDVVHTNSMITTFYALPIAKLMGIKLVNGSIRNAFVFRSIRWQLERVLLKLSNVRIANSEAGLMSRGLVPDNKKNIVVYNGFDMSRANNNTKDQLTRELGSLIKGKMVVGMVAEFSNYKDYRTFIEAAQIILKERNDVVFVTVGDGINLSNCKKMVPEECNGIIFLGKRQDVENIIVRFNIGVLATFTEGVSNSVMEYMAFRKPVIVTEGGGSREIVTDGENGFLVPPQNAEILASKMRYLLNNPDVAREMGEAGRKLIENKFSLIKLVENTLNAYKNT